MLPSLFSESAVTLPVEHDRRSPSSEGNNTDGFISVDPIQREGLTERLREMHLDTESSERSTSGTAISGADDDGSNSSQEAPVPKIQPIDPDQHNFLERYRHENKWLELKNRPIPSTRPDIDRWADEWYKAYQKGIRLGIPRFVNDGSRMAILDFMAAVELQDAETYRNSFLKEYTVSVEESDSSKEFHFVNILGRIANFWPEAKKNDTVDGEKNDKADSGVRRKRANTMDDWTILKNSNIPSTTRDLETWLDTWTTIYRHAVEMNFRYFIEHDSLWPKRDFVSRFRNEPEWLSFYDTYYFDLDSPEYSFADILALFQREWLVKKIAEKDKKCICGLSNHKTWKKCYYLNELIRPEGWIPNSKFMARVEEEAQKDPKLKKFIRNHRRKKLSFAPRKEEPKKEDKPKEDEKEEEEEDRGPVQVLFPIVTDWEMEDYEKIKTSFFFLSGSPVHICNDRSRFTTFKQRDPTLAQNKIHCLDPFNTTLDIHGVGEVIIKATAPDGREKAVTFRLKNVKHCPKAPCNVVSSGRLRSKGIYYVGLTNMLCVERDGEDVAAAKVEVRHGRYLLECNVVE